MKKWALLCGAALLFAGITSAQESPKAEVFGGYSYVRASALNTSLNFNGGGGSFSYNPTSWLGLVADFGGNHWTGSGVDLNVITYLFGPKIAFRRGRWTPFVQTLYGGAHASGSLINLAPSARVRPQIPSPTSASENAFAATMGGGLDWNATPHIGIRLAQAEFLITRFTCLGNNGSNNQNSFRFETGVVFRW